MLIIGLDLSFNSTGITISKTDDKNQLKSLDFYKVIPDDGVKHKIIKNITEVRYDIPDISNIIHDTSDFNNYEQISQTYKAMTASRKISNICLNELSSENIIYVAIENYIMPSFGGKNNLQNVSGLILLQGYVRQFFINYCEKLGKNLTLLTPSPSSIKKFFTKDGSATKEQMLSIFLDYFDGNKLLPSITMKDCSKVNDIIDSFALMMYTYYKINITNNQI